MMNNKQPVIKPKQFTYEEAFKSAKEDSNVVIISEVTKDKYKLEKINHEDKIKFFGPAISNWQNCIFILAAELTGKWNIEKDGVVITESIME